MRERSRRRACVLGCLMACSLLLTPGVAAGNGGGLMVLESIVVDGSGEVGVGAITVTLDVIEVEADDANVTLHGEVLSSAGAPLSESNLSISLNAGERREVSIVLAAVPPGIHQLRLTLLGDVALPTTIGAENGSDLDERFVSRLLPLSLTVESFEGWEVTPLNGSTGTPSGNSSVRDGDDVSLQVEVENEGDVGWNGSWVVEESDGIGGWTQASAGEVVVPSDGDGLIEATLGPVSEGDLLLRVRLVGLQDEDLADNQRTGTITVGPPAMPRPVLSLSANITGVEMGDSVVGELNISNLGDSSYVAVWACGWLDGVTVAGASGEVNLSAGQSVQLAIAFEARPGTLRCAAADTGVQANSVLQTDLSVDIPSASFTIAGSAGLALTGLPAHVGDTMVASVLVHNAGDISGDAVLSLTDASDSTSVFGDAVTIEAGSSREVTAVFMITSNGTHSIAWQITSPNGVWDASLSASGSYVAAGSQSLDVRMSVDEWTLANGLSVTVLTDLSAGPDRPVTFRVGHTLGTDSMPLLSFDSTLVAGQRSLSLALGQPSSGDLYIEVDTPGWTAAGSTSSTASATPPTTVLSIQHLAWGSGTDPVPGSRVHLTFDLVNDGGATSLPGTVRIIDASDDRLMKSFSVDAVGSQPEPMAVNIESWPSGSSVTLRIEWLTGADEAELIESIINAADPEAASASLPLEALGIGAAVGLAAGLVARLALRRDETSSGRRKTEPVKSARRKEMSHQPAAASDGKREVACPSCEQELRVPAAYAGRARCPACSTEFQTAAPATSEQQDEETDDSGDHTPGLVIADAGSDDRHPAAADEGAESATPVASESGSGITTGRRKSEGRRSAGARTERTVESTIPSDSEPVAMSEDDLLACPSCSQKLRVPLARRPTRARCPACRSEFRAEVG